MPLLRSTVMMSIKDLEEPGFWRKLSLSLVAMAVLTGAGLRSYRALVLTFGWSDSWLWIAGTFIGGAMFLFLMATLHLGNFPTRAWWWRAPLFALAEAATEILVSLALTYLGLEVVGSMQATFEDWQVTSLRTLFFRFAGISLFALVLALVSTVVRLLLLKGREVTHQ
ncbi:MAG TPA: hypothetical protein PK788_10260 [Gemmatimonadaceae bacterium]|nr:hypothetical protein [Gemmatimonadaceae bacterium]HRQ79424.1 hypothetical protein [Gemmatimonadaceae bacterium]